MQHLVDVFVREIDSDAAITQPRHDLCCCQLALLIHVSGDKDALEPSQIVVFIFNPLGLFGSLAPTKRNAQCGVTQLTACNGIPLALNEPYFSCVRRHDIPAKQNRLQVFLRGRVAVMVHRLGLEEHHLTRDVVVWKDNVRTSMANRLVDLPLETDLTDIPEPSTFHVCMQVG